MSSIFGIATLYLLGSTSAQQTYDCRIRTISVFTDEYCTELLNEVDINVYRTAESYCVNTNEKRFELWMCDEQFAFMSLYNDRQCSEYNGMYTAKFDTCSVWSIDEETGEPTYVIVSQGGEKIPVSDSSGNLTDDLEDAIGDLSEVAAEGLDNFDAQLDSSFAEIDKSFEQAKAEYD